MADSSVIRSRYTRNEIISVMQEVATLMGSRKQKAHYVTETSKINLQANFIAEKVASLNDKLKKLQNQIRDAEVTAKEPSETLLRLRSAKQTLTNEYARFNSIAEQSRQRVKGKNKETIEILIQEINDLSEQTIPLAKNLLNSAQQKNLDIQEEKVNCFLSMAKLHTDFTAALGYATDEMDKSAENLQGLIQKNDDVGTLLETLTNQEKKLSDDIPLLEQTIKEKQEDKKALEKELDKLKNTKKRIDALEDPKAYIDQLLLQFEEDKLSLEAKQDALEAVQLINNEVKTINTSLENGIKDYVSIFSEFEENLASI
nr:hypothetical protein [Desulfobulbaceae bacterium]